MFNQHVEWIIPAFASNHRTMATCGCSYNDKAVRNLLMNLTVKNSDNLSAMSKVMVKNVVASFWPAMASGSGSFFTPPYICRGVVGPTLLPGSVGSSRTSVDAASQESFVYPRRVLVIRAGPRPRRHAFVLLNKRTANSLEHVLSSFASAVCIDSGYIKQLFGVNTATQV